MNSSLPAFSASIKALNEVSAGRAAQAVRVAQALQIERLIGLAKLGDFAHLLVDGHRQRLVHQRDGRDPAHRLLQRVARLGHLDPAR